MDNSTDSSTSDNGEVEENSVEPLPSGAYYYVDTNGATGGTVTIESYRTNTISYDHDSETSLSYLYQDIYITCNLEKEGYVFIGWQVTNNGAINAYGLSSSNCNTVSGSAGLHVDFTYLITDSPSYNIGDTIYLYLAGDGEEAAGESIEENEFLEEDSSEEVKSTATGTPLFTALWEEELNYFEVEYDSSNDCWFFEDGYMPQEYVGTSVPDGVDESAASGAYTIRLTSSSFAQVLVYAGTEADYALVTIGDESGWFELQPIRWIVCYGSTLDTSVTTAVTEQVVTAGFIYSNAGTSFSWAMSSVLGMSVETLEASLELTNAAVGEFSYDSFSGTLTQLAVNEDSTTLNSKIAVSSTEELDALGGTYASTCTDFVAFLMSDGSNTIGGATEEYWTRDLVADLDSSSAYYSSTQNAYSYNGALNNGIYVTASGTLNNAKLSNRMGARLTMSLNGIVKEKVYTPEVYEDSDGYYVEMGYYPTTYAGLVSDCSFTSTGETFTLGDGTQYDIYTDGTDEYIQYTTVACDSDSHYTDGTFTEDDVDCYFKIEPIKWQVLGVYSAGATTEQTETSELTEYTGQELGDDEQLAVQSRLALEAMAWNSVYTDSSVNYNNSDIYSWLNSFYTNVLSDYSSYIVARTIDYNTTASRTGSSDYFDNYTTEYVWLTSYTEASKWYSTSSERHAYASDFAVGTGAVCDSSSSQATCWWTRTSSFLTSSVQVISGYCGDIVDFVVDRVDYAYFCVRPAMLISL